MKKILSTILCMTFALFGIAQSGGDVNSKFDFIPGEKIIFFDDFTSGAIGDFPVQWNTNSSGEVVTLGKLPGRWVQTTAGGFFIPEAKEKFTDNFTVEFDLYSTNKSNTEYLYNTDFIFVSGTLADPNEGGAIPGKAGTSVTANYDAIDWTNWAESAEGYKDRGTAPFGFKAGEK